MNYLHANDSMDKNTTLSSIHLVPVPWDWRLVVQLILAIVGIIGNSMVIHVYLHTRKMSRSATNRLIAALAVADVTTSICIIPIPTLSHVPDNVGGRFYCKVMTSSFVMWISVVASIMSLTILSIERYVAIVHPLHHRRFFSTQWTRFMIAMMWIFGFALNTFLLYTHHLDTETGVCIQDFGTAGFQIFIGLSVFIIEYLIPVVLMLATNIKSIQLLKLRARSNQKTQNLPMLKARQRIIYMLLVVIISFIICWSPDQFGFLAFNLGLVPSEYLYGNLYRVLVVLAFANSCINPILYCVTNTNFRQAIKHHLFRIGKPMNDLFNQHTGSASPFDTFDVSTSTSKGVTNVIEIASTSSSEKLENAKC